VSCLSAPAGRVTLLGVAARLAAADASGVSSDSAAVRAPDGALLLAARNVWARLERNAGPVSVFCIAVALTVLMLPHQLLLDGWLTLVSGREVVTNGLPASDTLHVWTSGAPWIDQQWLAQALFYTLAAAGGLPLVMLGHAALVAATIAIAFAAARSLGATPRNVALGGTAALLVAPWAIQMRTQSLVMPLFALLIWLLAADSRAPSRRVVLVFPLLLLWANLHGTVVLAALFACLRGVIYAFERRWPRAVLFTLAPLPCVLASPYALELPGYYESLFLEPSIRELAPEWGASTPSGWTVAFYLVAGATVWLLVRRRRRLTRFEQAALLATIAAGATAIRSLIWFAIAAAILVPQLLDERPARPRRATRLGLAAALTALVVSLGTAAAQPSSWYASSWPQPAADAVARLAAERPDARIFADGRYASWLLWEQPELTGRVSHDVRWELYTDAQFRTLLAFDGEQPGWRRATHGYDVLVLDRRTHPRQIAALRHDGLRCVWSDEHLAVLVRD
jgi:hypothetical protein